MKYVCSICGYVYDEAKEGTPFAGLPDAWACPVCGARYEVDSFDARVNECATCLDALDKRRIASVTPKHEVSASDPVPGLTYHKPLSDRFDSEWV